MSDILEAVETTTTEITETIEVEPVTKMAMGKRSFNQFVNDVHDAWAEKYNYSGWVVEVFEKYFIANKDKGMWKIPYTRDGETVTISDVNEWTAVKRSNDYVTKYAQHLTTIKSVGDNEETVGAYGILWGDENNRDYHNEYFTAKTAEYKAVFDGMGAIPLLFDHGFDNRIKSTVIGKVTKLEEDEIGLWFEAKLTEHETYKKMVKPLVEKRVLYPSSGVLPAAKRVKSTGEIVRWPIVEMTMTHRPAEYRMLDIPVAELQKHYKSAGLPELEVETDEPDNGSVKERLERQLKQQELETRLVEQQLNLGDK